MIYFILFLIELPKFDIISPKLDRVTPIYDIVTPKFDRVTPIYDIVKRITH
jgi:hypothetical protein